MRVVHLKSVYEETIEYKKLLSKKNGPCLEK